jgi:AraC-like DNA-binding protein
MEACWVISIFFAMNYKVFQPSPDLESLVKCYWTLEAPADPDAQRQCIVPDGCLEMAFILGDNIKRYTIGDDFIIQPRAMILGQTLEPFYIEPIGAVNTFAVRFYPYGFANFVSTPIKTLVNKETPLAELFEKGQAKKLEREINEAADTKERIAIIEMFLSDKFNDQNLIDTIVRTTIDALVLTKGNTPINTILKNDSAERRKLERKFAKQIGLSPKQLGKVIRLQAALKMMLNQQSESLTTVAYESQYYDQAHFIRDFKEFTGITPKEFLDDKRMALSSLFYKNE